MDNIRYGLTRTVQCCALLLVAVLVSRETDAAAAGAVPWTVPLVKAEQWGSVSETAAPLGTPDRQPYRSRPQTHIIGLTVHHQGEIWTDGADVAAYLRRLQQWSRRDRNWVDVPYHYIVAPDGAVYEGRSVQWAGDSNTDYDTQGHVQVMLLGNFEEQQPHVAQLRATASLLGQLMRTHSLGADRIVAHRHHTSQTVCPGENLMAVFEALLQHAREQARDQVREQQSAAPKR